MGVVFDFFGEEVAGVDDARNVSHLDDVALVSFANAVLVEIDVLGTFEGDGGGPVAGGFVVVVDGDALGGVRETEVDGTVFDAEEIVDAFVGSVDFCDAGAVCCFVLSYGFPCNRAASTTDNITGEGTKFE